MATGDMKARLLLDGKEFDLTLQRAKKKTEDFRKSGKKAGDDVTAAFKKVTAAIAAIKGAEAAFDSVINSSQVLGDKFRANIEGMKTVVDNFVYSLANADFTIFSNNLADMFRKGKEAAAAADQYSNTQMSVNFKMATRGADYRAAMAKARNKNLSSEERKQALDNAKAIGEELMEAQKTLERDAYDALRKALSAKTTLDSSLFTDDAILRALNLDAGWDNKENREQIQAKYDAFNKEVGVYKSRTKTAKLKYQNAVGFEMQMARLREYEAAQEEGTIELARLQRENADIITQYALLFRDKDEALASAYTLAQSTVAARNQLAEIETSTNKVGVTLAADMDKAAKAAAKLAEETRQVREEQERLAAFVARNPMNLSPVGFSPSAGALPSSVSAMNYNPAQTALDTMDKSLISDAEKMRKSLDDTNTVVGMLSGSFAQLGGNIEGTAGNMLTFVGSTLEAVQALIPLIGYIQAEITMRNANASAAAKEAAAKVLSAYAGMPFAGVALGVAAVASIIGVLKSVPKFAEGGIVNRATLGVFGEAGPEAVMPLDKLEEYITPRELRVTGNIKASGKDLVVVLDNYNRVRNG